MFFRLFIFLVLVSFTPISTAHDVFSGELNVVVSEEKMTMELNLAAVSAEIFTQDIVGRNNQISPENLANITTHLTNKAKGFFDVSIEQVPIEASEVDIRIITEEDAVVFVLHYPQKVEGLLAIESHFIDHTNPEYKLTVNIVNSNGVQLGLFIHTYTHRHDEVQVDINATAANTDGVFKNFLVLGIEHILIGFDHLIFLLALLLICRNWKDAAIIITCFTFAHSITLSLASLQIVSLPSQWIELAIALTIVYVGFENIYFKHKPKYRWLLTSCFGLIHGLGFANVLMGLGLGSQGAPIFLPLLAFNLGVEIGQLSLSIIVLPILWYLAKFKSFEKFGVPLISVVISAFGILWVFERIG